MDKALLLEKVTLHHLAHLIQESEGAFLPSASNPLQTTTQLFEKFKDLPGFQPYAYRINGQLVSYIVALGHKDPSTISIGPMYVAKDYRGQGLGVKQVKAFVEQARVDGYKKIYTKTWSTNISSRKIFESLGFEVVGIKQDDRANGDATIEYDYYL